MYKILFIDEENDTLQDFEEFVEKSSSKAKIKPITTLPLPDLDEMIESIIKIAPDAVISDYRLNELKTDIKYTVKYNGVDLVEEFQSIRNHFPCFANASGRRWIRGFVVHSGCREGIRKNHDRLQSDR